ncbi:MAG: hypothetical protein EZS28_000855 [Streblomastix strix]|uniref:Uncharacterized protein n=2 Tax=Streblomastix strix TaxID=222440 RepID=A0A5J4X915_9EUKA|nr:MAG: hypothetical protein EZS28_000855 [Streblomastix strix]
MKQAKERSEAEHAEVIRLTAEITKLNQSQLSVFPSLNPNMLAGKIHDRKHAYQEGIKIIHTDKEGDSSIAFNPIIQSGIVRFGGYFQNHQEYNFCIGIADSSTVFGSEKGPEDGENRKKTVRYYDDGEISHIGYKGFPGNSPIELNKSVAMEIFLRDQNSSFTITEFENLQYSSAKGGIKGQRILEWGKE